jgi:cytochrome c-type biogenesis protein CcmH/NrfG
MNTGTKTLAALVAILIIAAGAYYMLTTSPKEGAMMENEALVPVTAENADAMPAATDSVDDFAEAMQAELSASASAIKALDADVDATVDTVVNSSNNVYDPSNL